MGGIAVLKQPKGFLKILEIIFAIAAFATLVSYNEKGKVVQDIASPVSDNETIYPFVIGYDFGDDDLYFETEQGKRLLEVDGKHKTGAGFFNFVGVVSFLMSVFLLCFYAFGEDKLAESRQTTFFTVDFIQHAVVAFFWFVAACVWADATNTLPGIVNRGFDDFVNSNLTQCVGIITITCTRQKPSYGDLIVCSILAFLNCFLWAANCWFVFKETKWLTKKQSARSENSTGKSGESYQ